MGWLDDGIKAYHIVYNDYLAHQHYIISREKVLANLDSFGSCELSDADRQSDFIIVMEWQIQSPSLHFIGTIIIVLNAHTPKV